MLCQKSNTELLQLAEQICHIWYDDNNYMRFIALLLWWEGVRVVELFEFTDDCSESSIVLYV